MNRVVQRFIRPLLNKGRFFLCFLLMEVFPSGVPKLTIPDYMSQYFKNPVVMALEEEVRIQSKGLEKEKKLQQSKLNGLLLDKAEALGLQGM